MPRWKKDKAKAMRNASTPAESRLWTVLARRQVLGAKFRRQAPLYGWIADFWCPQLRLVIEADGRTHDSAADAHRDHVMAEKKITVLRFRNERIYDDLDGVRDEIEHAVAVLQAEVLA